MSFSFKSASTFDAPDLVYGTLQLKHQPHLLLLYGKFGALIHNIKSNQQQVVLCQGGSGVFPAVLSSDDKVAFLVQGGKTVMAVDTATGNQLHSPHACAAHIYSIAVHRSGTLVAVGDCEGNVHLLNGHNMTVKKTAKIANRDIISLAFSTNKMTLACGTGSGRCVILDLGLTPLPGFDASVGKYCCSCAFDPEEKMLVAGGVDGALKVLNAATGAVVADFSGKHGASAWVNSVAFVSDVHIVSCGSDRKLRIHCCGSESGGQQLAEIATGGGQQASISCDGCRVVVSHRESRGVELFEIDGVSQRKQQQLLRSEASSREHCIVPEQEKMRAALLAEEALDKKFTEESRAVFASEAERREWVEQKEDITRSLARLKFEEGKQLIKAAASSSSSSSSAAPFGMPVRCAPTAVRHYGERITTVDAKPQILSPIVFGISSNVAEDSEHMAGLSHIPDHFVAGALRKAAIGEPSISDEAIETALDKAVAKVNELRGSSTSGTKMPACEPLDCEQVKAIHIYTQGDSPIIPLLTTRLHDAQRLKLKPWMPFLRLLLTSLLKLPPIPANCTVYRGVRQKLSNVPEYSVGKSFIWWGFSSCSESLTALHDAIGDSGQRTIFAIKVGSPTVARSIQRYSDSGASEVLLTPGTMLKVVKHTVMDSSADGLTLIELEEVRSMVAGLATLAPTGKALPVAEEKKAAGDNCVVQ